ncbi:RNA-guided endonuclease InsQ/TnpB family protein [Roseofilum capinflatum]|uniref:Transposase n=1 Tax=Roseofilum capinflatum BLCC-M114 TaxID=3022440 RepID=A0ABT7B4E0_9CYAN|nr:transposase [Roseofilum capinflatum]MDJ1174047.1 transposase [Roseofilum capinflatum BLCC-M114]
MILTYEYRLRPTNQQAAQIDWWLELLRRHWNYALGQRLDYLRRTRSQIDRCSLVSEPIGEIPEQVNYYTQQAALKETKVLFPEYQEIYSEVQQINLQRLDKAWKKWRVPDKSGKRGGRPRFKKAGQLRSFEFSRVNHPKSTIKFDGKNLITTRLGKILVIRHRPIPEGFELKTASIVKKADGYYVCLVIKDDTIAQLLPLETIKSAVGADVGLKEFLTTSNGETVAVKQHYRQAQKHLAHQQRRLARKQKGSSNYLKQQNQIAKLHQKIARQRKDFHYKIAHALVKTYDLIAVEDLNIKGLARTRLASSVLDVAWGQFINILETVAVKCGVRVVKVNPHGTSQNCSNCGAKVPKTLSIRTHECPKCGLIMDRDENAAVNILNRAIEQIQAVGLIVSACGGLDVSQPVKQETLKGEWVQLSLF